MTSVNACVWINLVKDHNSLNLLFVVSCFFAFFVVVNDFLYTKVFHCLWNSIVVQTWLTYDLILFSFCSTLFALHYGSWIRSCANSCFSCLFIDSVIMLHDFVAGRYSHTTTWSISEKVWWGTSAWYCTFYLFVLHIICKCCR